MVLKDKARAMYLKRRVFQFNIALWIIMEVAIVVSVCSLAFAEREHKPGIFVIQVDPGFSSTVVSPDGNTIVKYETINENNNRVSFYDCETNELLYQFDYDPHAGHSDTNTHSYKAWFSPDSAVAVLNIIFNMPRQGIEPFINLKLKRIIYQSELGSSQDSSYYYFSPDGQISYSAIKTYTPQPVYHLNFGDAKTGSELWDGHTDDGFFPTPLPSVTSDGKNISFTVGGGDRSISTPTQICLTILHPCRHYPYFHMQ